MNKKNEREFFTLTLTESELKEMISALDFSDGFENLSESAISKYLKKVLRGKE